jgi:hypothetical protein
MLSISHTTIHRWTKDVTRKSYKQRVRIFDSKQLIDGLRIAIDADPFISTRDLQTRIKNVFNIVVSKDLIRAAIYRLGFTKKNARFHGIPTHLKKTTDDFIKLRDHYIAEGRFFVSIDETSFGRNGSPTKGYAPLGKRLYVTTRKPYFLTKSMCAAISKEGWIKTLVRSGSFDTASFFDFLNTMNAPQGSILLMDNVRFHHTKVVKELCDLKGWIILFVPPYSPWYNPIEGMFSVVKRHFYKTMDIHDSIHVATKEHSAAFFKHSLSQGPEHPSGNF